MRKLFSGRSDAFRFLLVASLALANVVLFLAPSTTRASTVESIDWACEEYAPQKCHCTDAMMLHECQLSGDPGTCTQLYPLACQELPT